MGGARTSSRPSRPRHPEADTSCDNDGILAPRCGEGLVNEQISDYPDDCDHCGGATDGFTGVGDASCDIPDSDNGNGPTPLAFRSQLDALTALMLKMSEEYWRIPRKCRECHDFGS